MLRSPINTHTATVRIQEGRGVARDLTYHLTNDYMTVGNTVISQPVGVRRMVETQDDIVEWMLIPHSNSSVDERFVFTGGNSAKVVSGGHRVQEFDEWETVTGPFPNLQFRGVDGELNPQVIGAPTTIYVVNALKCRTSTYAVTGSRRP